MATLPQEQPENEVIIRFSGGWWAYLVFRLGALRAFVNSVEDALAITGRFLLLVFLIYCGAKAGILLSAPNATFPAWLEMSMFILQLAGLEGSIPGLARQVDTLRARNDEDASKKVEGVMLSARIMTVLSIGEGALHALGIPAIALQIISAILLVTRGVVITNFLIALAKMEAKAPRVLSKEAHTREMAQQAQRDIQSRTIADLTARLDETTKALTTAKQQARQDESNQERSITQLQEQIRRMEEAQTSLLNGSEGQGTLIKNLQTQLTHAEQQVNNLTASLEQKRRDFDRAMSDLQSAKSAMARLQNVEGETANLQSDKQQLAANLETANLQIADLTAKLERAKNKIADLQTTKNADAQPAKSRPANNITQIDQARAKSKLSHAEVVAFMSSHPDLKRAEVAAQLTISERKVYDALAWQKEQESENAVGLQ